jgi:hypothetical protein
MTDETRQSPAETVSHGLSAREYLRNACANGGNLGCSCADQNYQWYGPSCEATMTSVLRTMLRDQAQSPQLTTSHRPEPTQHPLTKEQAEDLTRRST